MSLKVRFNDIGDTLHCSRFFVEDCMMMIILHGIDINCHTSTVSLVTSCCGFLGSSISYQIMFSKSAKLCIFLGCFEMFAAWKYWVHGPDPKELQVR